MSIFNRFRREPPPPPPPPIYKRQPIATAAVILTMVAMFVLGPIGYLWNGMAEEMKVVKAKIEEVQKEKATNEDVKAALEELKAQRKEQAAADKEQNNKLQTNQLAIKEILTRQEMLTAPKGFELRDRPKDAGVTDTPRSTKPKETKMATLKVPEKKTIPPEQFEKYLEMKPENQERYRKYLERRGYDTDGL